MSTHKCPAPGCKADVPTSLFACGPHWYTLPKPLRDEVWRAYRDAGALSAPHIAAMAACSDYLRAAS